ncbi:MAG: hypothetical protein GQ582_04645, partial [Methyloprofundus sp.]|nr:hypothetical protein [Methyloprofundus sp.]
MVALGAVLAIILAIANKKLFVFEDPRIEEVDEMLPQAQCGACGTPGCRPFAEAVVEGTKNILRASASISFSTIASNHPIADPHLGH